MNMVRVLAVAAATSLLAGEALAGATASTAVVVDLDGKAAQGSQTAARFSDNDVELIGCGIRVADDGTNPVFKFGFCQATDANGVLQLCTTFSPDLLEAINGISDYGFLRFTWNDSAECVSVGNSTQSVYIPSFKLKK